MVCTIFFRRYRRWVVIAAWQVFLQYVTTVLRRMASGPSFQPVRHKASPQALPDHMAHVVRCLPVDIR